jgi:hypothetical protein
MIMLHPEDRKNWVTVLVAGALIGMLIFAIIVVASKPGAEGTSSTTTEDSEVLQVGSERPPELGGQNGEMVLVKVPASEMPEWVDDVPSLRSILLP